MLERLFRLTENRTTARTELLAGVTTFLAMAYIIFHRLQPMRACENPFRAVAVAGCAGCEEHTLLWLDKFSGGWML